MKPFCFSLSGIYESEGYAWEQAGKIWDLRELRGTDGYLDPETEQFLEAELGRKKETKELPRIRLLDSGNYHYMSKLLLGLEKEDLFLAVFDHHTDMQPPALLPVLSCGSWIRDAAGAYQNIKGICVIGPPEASVRETEAMEHVWFVTQEELDDGYAWEQAGKIWDLRELRGTDGYLDPETEQFLEAELGRKKETKELPRIRLLDSGNYHYMSKLLLGLEKEDLFLAVFDHHTDMQPPALLPVLSCGSWIRDAAGAYQNIKGICVIGPPEASVRETEAMEHVWFVTQEELDDGSGAAKIKEIFASHAGTFPVYLSVDKDILSKEELDTNWDQGNVRVDELLSIAKDCLAGRKVLAVDLCGEPSANAPEAECSAASLVNQKLYGALAAKIED